MKASYKKVILVDDNIEYRDALSLAIALDFDVETIMMCSDGDEVLEVWKNNTDTDFILMDISMKRMDGISATKLLRKNGVKIPIIILSMHDEGRYSKVAKESEASGFLLKVSDLVTINEAIRRVLSGEEYFQEFNS